MTDQSKIPVPRDDVPGEDAVSSGAPRRSLIERAAERFDFRSHMAPPPPVVAPKLVRAKNVAPERPAVPVAPVSPVVESDIPPSSVGVERSRDPLAPGSRVSTSLDTNGEGGDLGSSHPFGSSFDTNEITNRGALAPTQKDASRPAIFSTKRFAVDRETLRDNGLIVPEGSVTALLEEFRIVKRQLMLQAAELRRGNAGPKAQRVLISSPHPGEGKTYCAVNLALSIAAERDSDVLLVDADFAKPSILSSLGLPGGPGLMDALMDEGTDVVDFVIGTDVPGLWVLPAGDTTTADSEYLSSSRTASVLDRLTQDAPNRMVIFDSPPALAASPAAELAKYVGQVLAIVRADSTGQGALEDAVSLLSACPNIQLLLNGAQFSPSGRSFGTYYGYKG